MFKSRYMLNVVVGAAKLSSEKLIAIHSFYQWEASDDYFTPTIVSFKTKLFYFSITLC